MQKQSPLKRDKLKKASKLITSRMFYLCLGLFFSLAIFVANAAWNSTVSTGNPLTATLWNDVVAKLVELDNNKLDACQIDQTIATCGSRCSVACPAGYTVSGGGVANCDRPVTSRPNGNGWEGQCGANSAGTVYAVCIKVSCN